MIGRHVHRHHRFRPRAAIERELPRQEPEHHAAPRILDDHDLLEARLVVGRERRHQLLHRRVDRLEHRHLQQVVLGALQHALADHVGRHRAGHQDERRRHQHAEPGHRAAEHVHRQRPCHAVDEPEIHTSAATLMISGTVTKRPVRKLRRSHAMHRLRDPSRQTTPPSPPPARTGSTRTPSANEPRGTAGKTSS